MRHILYNNSNLICNNLINDSVPNHYHKTISRKSKLNKLSRNISYERAKGLSRHAFHKGYKYIPKDLRNLFKTRMILRDYTQGNMYRNNIKDTNHPFYWWLAGFIEGDGNMTYSQSNNNKYPRLKIELGMKDLATLYLIKRTLGIGKIYMIRRKDRIPCVQFLITKKDHILYIINILQGKILLHNKQITYTNWVAMYNICYNTNIIPSLLRCQIEKDFKTIQTILATTAWLSGLIDAEACFSISRKTAMTNSSYIHSFRLENKDSLVFYKLLIDILFGSANKKITVYTRPNGVNIIYVSQVIKENVQSNTFITLINYLKYHPLKSRKRLAYSYWLKSYNLLLSGRSKSTRRGHTRLINSINSLTLVNTKLKLSPVDT